MKTTNEIRREVMLRAWKDYRMDFGTFSECLTDAWEIVKELAKPAIVELATSFEGIKNSVAFGTFNSFFKSIQKVAEEKGHFVSDILSKMEKGYKMTEKQGWCVAYFAKANNFVK